MLFFVFANILRGRKKAESRNKDKKTVLFIDPDKSILSNFSALFLCLDYQDRFDFFTKNLDEGLKILNSVQIDFLITEINLGLGKDYNGLDLARTVIIINPDAKIFLLHSLGGVDIRFEFPFEELRKPIQVKKIIERLYEVDSYVRLVQVKAA